LGVTMDKLQTWEESSGSLSPDVLAYKMDISVDEFNEKLKGQSKVNLDDDDDDSDDDDSETEDEPTLDEWLNLGITTSVEEIGAKVGVELAEVQPMMDGKMIFPIRLVETFKFKKEEVYEKLTGKKPA